MPVQILPEQIPSPLTRLLTGFGTGLGSGLQEGIKQFQDRRAIQGGLEKIGLSKEKAEGISRLSPELQKLALGGTSGIAGKDLSPLLRNLGMPEDKAAALGKLFSSVGLGGQTEVVKLGLDMLQRGGVGSQEPGTTSPQVTPDVGGQTAGRELPLGDSRQGQEGEKKPDEGIFKGLTPKERVARENDILKSNEPKLQELSEKINSTKERILDFDRLQNIFTEASDKLPSSFTSAFFDLEGESGLSNFGRSMLSTEAQEASKIVINQLRGLKNTLGSQITGFEVKTYLKGLPGLLNTPEGRKRVAKQISTINQINLLGDQAILDEVEKAGGPHRIPFSEAQSRAMKKIEPQLEALKNQYRNPDSKIFNALPVPSFYSGKRIKDEETGRVFKSNGKEWIPEE